MHSGLGFERVLATARGLAPRSWLLLAVALCCALAAMVATDPWTRASAAMAAGTFAALVVAIRGLAMLAARTDRQAERSLSDMLDNDPAPCVAADALGRIAYRNHAARERFAADDGVTLFAALGGHFANPGAVLYRLQTRAVNIGSAREDVSTRRGVTRLSVHRLGAGNFLWRFEEFVDRGTGGRGAEALSLPMLVANKAGVVLFSNEAMRRLVGTRPKRLDKIFGAQTPNSGEEVEIAGAQGAVRAI
ncbi:MAG TPA: hybrid sensor histidine kinase/response regulator, partial [Paracoccaceae bacterium]|nr:hybrid sensor histidine kinase/response regulator [Paracoccaceae bacterium]